MSRQHVAFVTAVDTKHIQRANGQSFDLWQVHDSDGSTWVVKPPLANFAQSLVGQQVLFTTREEVKVTDQGNQFTNYYADAIVPYNGQQAAQQPQQPAPQPEAQQFAPPTQPVQVREANPQPIWPTPKDLSIMRQTAGKVAAVVGDDTTRFWLLITQCDEYFRTGRVPPDFERARAFAEQTVQASVTAYAEGASLSDEQGSGDYQDEDIPF